MLPALTVLVIGEDTTVWPYLAVLAKIWPTSSSRDSSPVKSLPPEALARTVVAELFDDGSMALRLGGEALRIGLRPTPEDLAALVGLMFRASEAIRQLHAIEDMDPLGVIAGAVAHDANNLLVVVLGSLAGLSRAGADESLVRAAKEAAVRIAALLGRFTALRGHDVDGEADLNVIIGELAPTMRALVGPEIELRFSLDPTLPPAKWPIDAVERALINLVANSRDALPAGGHIEIRTYIDPAAPERKAGVDRTDEAQAVVLEVSDNGSGMPLEILQRIFEPLFTTKPRGMGTGLGLKSVHRSVTRAGGDLNVESRPGNGTKVVIRLQSARS